MSHADAKNVTRNVVQTDVLMETNRFLMSTPEPEMNVDDNDDVITNNYQDLDLLSPISLQNNNFNLKHYSQGTRGTNNNVPVRAASAHGNRT